MAGLGGAAIGARADSAGGAAPPQPDAKARDASWMPTARRCRSGAREREGGSMFMLGAGNAAREGNLTREPSAGVKGTMRSLYARALSGLAAAWLLPLATAGCFVDDT